MSRYITTTCLWPQFTFPARIPWQSVSRRHCGSLVTEMSHWTSKSDSDSAKHSATGTASTNREAWEQLDATGGAFGCGQFVTLRAGSHGVLANYAGKVNWGHNHIVAMHLDLTDFFRKLGVYLTPSGCELVFKTETQRTGSLFSILQLQSTLSIFLL